MPSVTVSATRRNASLQSVPVAVTVLDGDALNNANRTSIDTIVQEVPSVTFRQQGGNKDSTIFVRGIGTISTSPGVEPTVSTVIDGVFKSVRCVARLTIGKPMLVPPNRGFPT